MQHSQQRQEPPCNQNTNDHPQKQKIMINQSKVKLTYRNCSLVAFAAPTTAHRASSATLRSVMTVVPATALDAAYPGSTNFNNRAKYRPWILHHTNNHLGGLAVWFGHKAHPLVHTKKKSGARNQSQSVQEIILLIGMLHISVPFERVR